MSELERTTMDDIRQQEWDALRTQLTDALRQRDAAVLVRNALNIATDRLEAERDEAMRERDAWIETAQIESENKEFYRGLVIKIGEPFGPPAYTSDDGSVQQDVLALKVPELVSALKSERDNAVAQVAVCMGALTECSAIFRKYADIHNAKGTAEGVHKARRNDNLANACDQALSSIGAQAERLLKVVALSKKRPELHVTGCAYYGSPPRQGCDCGAWELRDALALLTASTNPSPEKGTT